MVVVFAAELEPPANTTTTYYATGSKNFYTASTLNSVKSAHTTPLDLVFATLNNITNHLSNYDGYVPAPANKNSQNNNDVDPTSDLANTTNPNNTNDTTPETPEAPKDVNNHHIWTNITLGNIKNSLIKDNKDNKAITKSTDYQSLSIGYDYSIFDDQTLGFYFGLANANSKDNANFNHNRIDLISEGIYSSNTKAIEAGTYYALKSNGYDINALSYDDEDHADQDNPYNQDNPEKENPEEANSDNNDTSFLDGLIINSAIKYSYLTNSLRLNNAINKNDLDNVALTINQDLGYNIKLDNELNLISKASINYAYISGIDLKNQKQSNNKTYTLISTQDSINLIQPSVSFGADYKISSDSLDFNLKANAALLYTALKSKINIASNKTTDSIDLNQGNIGANINLSAILQLTKDLKANINLNKGFFGNLTKNYEVGFGVRWGF